MEKVCTSRYRMDVPLILAARILPSDDASPRLLLVSETLLLGERNQAVESDQNLLKLTREMEAVRAAGGPSA